MSRTSRRPRFGLGLLLILVAAFFIIPLYATAKFGFTLPGKGFTMSEFTDVIHDPRLWPQLWLSLKLAFWTTILLIPLMVPTVTWLHLKAPKLRPLAEGVSILPFIVPPIVLVAGVSTAFRSSIPQLVNNPLGLIPFYMVLGLPFTYRMLDAGLRAIDLKIMTEASRGLGAGWGKTLWLVVMPNIRSAVIGASFLTVAVVLGEYTIAALLLHSTFSVFLVTIGGSKAQGSAAIAFASIMFTWLLLGVMSVLTRRRGGRASLQAIAP
jgi:putative spermidine/putrescine transport system permease protein